MPSKKKRPQRARRPLTPEKIARRRADEAKLRAVLEASTEPK